MHFNTFLPQVKSKGFTLIETIIGIVVLAVSLSVIITLINPLAEKSAEQLHQIKATELGQSMLNEIQNKAFDQHSDMAGGLIRCGEYSIECSTTMGKDSESRATFNDVDDYNGLTYLTGNIENSQGQVLSLYTGYAMKVRVCNDADYSGPNCDGALDNNISTAKLIIVTVTTPTGFDIVFSTYRANF